MESSGKERRLEPRFSAELQCAVTMPEEDILFPREKLECRTRDLSPSGIGLVASSIYIGYDCIVDAGRTLRLTLELPGGAVGLTATAAHYLRLDRGGEEPVYFVGLRVVEMSDDDRARYTAYLNELGRAGTREEKGAGF